MSKKEKRYQEMLDEVLSEDQLIYLFVPCSTRSKETARRARVLVYARRYAKALKLADPIAYNLGLSEFEG